jgi:N-acetylglucosaminyldiphosphoundecaprenol N-acetyl-beta-D-mannosaminyltransferase
MSIATQPSSVRRFSLGGISLDALRHNDLIELMKGAISERKRLLILNHNLHSLYLYRTDASFRNFYSRASYTYIDGLPIVWLGKAVGQPLSTAHRITFLDSFENILAEASKSKWRVFYLGSAETVIAMALPLLRERHPGLVIDGRNGFFDMNSSAEAQLIQRMNEFEPDVLFVGMGMPRQEKWLEQNFDRLRVHVALTSGATLDYVTGHAYRPPRWVGALGLYGIARMITDPGRLWRRYLIEPLHLARYFFPSIIQYRIRQWSNGSNPVP